MSDFVRTIVKLNMATIANGRDVYVTDTCTVSDFLNSVFSEYIISATNTCTTCCFDEMTYRFFWK